MDIHLFAQPSGKFWIVGPGLKSPNNRPDEAVVLVVRRRCTDGVPFEEDGTDVRFHRLPEPATLCLVWVGHAPSMPCHAHAHAAISSTGSADERASLTDILDHMKPVTEVEVEVMNRLASSEFEGVIQLRAQIASVSQVEPNCACGCPSFTPVIDRSVAPASPLRTLLPTELVEEERSDGVPRTVIWFADAEGYISNVECVYYDDALDEWPDPRLCTVRG